MNDPFELACNWGLRFARGIVLGLAALILAKAQDYAPLPAWSICIAVILLSLVNGLHRYSFAMLPVLLAMAVVPPSLLSAAGTWILALIK